MNKRYKKGDTINLRDSCTALVLNDGIKGGDFNVRYEGKFIEYLQRDLPTTSTLSVYPGWHRPPRHGEHVYYEVLIGDMKCWTTLKNLNEYDATFYE